MSIIWKFHLRLVFQCRRLDWCWVGSYNSLGLEERSRHAYWGVILTLSIEEVMGPKGSSCQVQSSSLVGQSLQGKYNADKGSEIAKSCYCRCLWDSSFSPQFPGVMVLVLTLKTQLLGKQPPPQKGNLSICLFLLFCLGKCLHKQ